MAQWIKINLSREDIERCWQFSNAIIGQRNQYDRMMKAGVSRGERETIRVKRTFVGKIGEMAFYRYLESLGICSADLEEMFAIFAGETNVDRFDFKTADASTIDVKTAVFANHRNLVVPNDQFCRMPKDFYVGIKLEIPQQIRDYTQIGVEHINDIYICGYATRERLQQQPVVNLGEFPCRALPLVQLIDISRLLSLFA